jgi:hypothetical protein
MTQQETKSIVDKFADVARVLMDADPDDKAEIYQHRPDHGVRYSWWRCVVTSGDAAAGRCAGD